MFKPIGHFNFLVYYGFIVFLPVSIYIAGENSTDNSVLCVLSNTRLLGQRCSNESVDALPPARVGWR